jgi:hypothetical protein
MPPGRKRASSSRSVKKKATSKRRYSTKGIVTPDVKFGPNRTRWPSGGRVQAGGSGGTATGLEKIKGRRRKR